MDKLGFALCGSFCTHAKALDVLRELVGDYDVTPIVSERAASTETRFGTPGDLLAELERLTGKKPVTRIDASPEKDGRKRMDQPLPLQGG